jgi:tripartite-type tricarboxylate transporter receptor subunit TctC
VRDKKATLLLQLNLTRHPDLADVPLAIDFVERTADGQLFEFFMARMVTAYPFAAPPDVPADRLQALRKAFDDTMKDPALLADAKRQNMEIDPVSGETVLQLLKRVYASPKEVVDRARGIIQSNR